MLIVPLSLTLSISSRGIVCSLNYSCSILHFLFFIQWFGYEAHVCVITQLVWYKLNVWFWTLIVGDYNGILSVTIREVLDEVNDDDVGS